MKLTPTQLRILTLLNERGVIRTMSGLYYEVFPDNRPRSPQGAALNMSRHIQPLVRAKLVSDWSTGPAEYRLTSQGREALSAATSGAEAQ